MRSGRLHFAGINRLSEEQENEQQHRSDRSGVIKNAVGITKPPRLSADFAEAPPRKEYLLRVETSRPRALEMKIGRRSEFPRGRSGHGSAYGAWARDRVQLREKV